MWRYGEILLDVRKGQAMTPEEIGDRACEIVQDCVDAVKKKLTAPEAVIENAECCQIVSEHMVELVRLELQLCREQCREKTAEAVKDEREACLCAVRRAHNLAHAQPPGTHATYRHACNQCLANIEAVDERATQ